MAGWNPARAIAVLKLRDPSIRTYLKAILESRAGKHLIDAVLNTTVQKTLNLKDIKRLPIPLPTRHIRDQISQFSEIFADRITLLRETNKTLESIVQAIFKSWFVDFDPVRAKMEGRQPEGMDEETAALFPDSFEESEYGAIPQGWSIQPLSIAYEINPSRRLSKGTVSTYLEMANVPTDGLSVAATTRRPFGSGTKFVNGDTLLARITPCLENGKTAFVDFLEDDEVGWGSTEFVVLRPKSPLPPLHAYLLCRTQSFRDHAIQSMSGTSGRQRVQNDVLGHYMVPIPSEEIARKFSGICASLHKKIAANHSIASTLATLRDTLLPRLISGQLRLPEAEALVEEINP